MYIHVYYINQLILLNFGLFRLCLADTIMSSTTPTTTTPTTSSAHSMASSQSTATSSQSTATSSQSTATSSNHHGHLHPWRRVVYLWHCHVMLLMLVLAIGPVGQCLTGANPTPIICHLKSSDFHVAGICCSSRPQYPPTGHCGTHCGGICWTGPTRNTSDGPGWCTWPSYNNSAVPPLLASRAGAVVQR